jgi:hypothetical protein
VDQCQVMSLFPLHGEAPGDAVHIYYLSYSVGCLSNLNEITWRWYLFRFLFLLLCFHFPRHLIVRIEDKQYTWLPLKTRFYYPMYYVGTYYKGLCTFFML